MGLRRQMLSALAMLIGLVALASAGQRDPGGMFSRWSPQDEITSLRTEDSKTFDNRDGTRSVVIAGPMHRPVAPGIWQESAPDAGPLDEDSTVQVGDSSDGWPCVWFIGANYFRCQHLYLDSELNFSGYITKIAFWSDSAGSDTLNQSCHWLREFPDTVSSLPDTWITEGTRVWDSSLVRSDTGWNILPLQTCFFHSRGSNLLASYRHADGSKESLYKCYRASYQGTSTIRAHWGYSNSNPQPALQQRAYRANILITYVPLSETLDVQTLTILSPVDSVPWGQPCVPRAVVCNNGVDPATFPVSFSINDGYAAADTVTGLPPGAEDTVAFATWTPDSTGSFAVKCSTCLAGDQHPENDTQTRVVSVTYHDVGAYRIVAPAGVVPSGDSVRPDVTVRNCGTAPENPWLVVEISRAGSSVYAESVQQSVNAGDTVEVLLSRYWHADSLGDYDVRAWTNLPGDMNGSNDSAHRSFQVQYLPLHDAGAIRILAPKDSVVQDSVVQPQAVVRNFGRSSENVPVSFAIARSETLVYCDTIGRTLPPGTTDTISTFRLCTLAVPGNYRTFCRTLLSGDLDSSDDTVSDSFRVTHRQRHDIAVDAILAPVGTIDTGTTCTPRVRIGNLGDYVQTGVVHFTVIASGGARQPFPDVRLNQIEPGTTRDTFFSSWTAHRPGQYTACCSLEFAPDDCRANDTMSGLFDVQEPTPWHQMAVMPAGVQHKSVRGGAALAAGAADVVYALKGNGTREFYAYHAPGDSWSQCCSIPRTRRSARSAALCYSPGSDRVYAASASSSEFWEYRPKDNVWSRRVDVPAGVSGRRAGPGSGLATMDTGLVYLLKGGGARELWAYDPAHDTWFRRAPAPAGSSARGYRVGSCIAAARDYLYLLKGGCNEFFAYSTLEDTWYNRMPLPLTGTGGKRKPARAGTAIAPDHDVIYVLKGGKCGDLWWYDTFGDSWVERCPVPLGPDWRPVADGGALAFASGKLWALKGNNTREFWTYQPPAADRSPLSAGRSKEIQGQSAVCTPRLAVRVNPNPFAGSTTVSCSLPMPGEVSLKLFDASGRLVRTLYSGFHPTGVISAEVGGTMSPGVYLLRASTATHNTTRLLVRG